MRPLLKRLFKRENFVALLLVAAAVISVFEIPQKLGVSETKLVLILVGFLAIDSLIEKIGYFEELETRTRRIETVVKAHPDAVILQSRKSLPPFSECITGKKNVFVLAISGNSLIPQYSRDIERALKAGTNFKFILTSPDSTAMQALSYNSASPVNVDTQITWIKDSIAILRHLAETKPKGSKLELRLFKGTPTTSIIAYDIERDNGWIQIEPHVYRQAPVNRPVFVLHANSKSEWFEFHQKVIQELWNASEPA